MIYYKDKVEISYLDFRNQLSLEVASTFGISDVDNIEELTLMLLHHMTLSYKEVLMGGHSYQTLVHPIVYVDRPVPYRINEPTPKMPMSPTINPNPWWDPNKGVWMGISTTVTTPANVSGITTAYAKDWKKMMEDGTLVFNSESSMTKEEYELNRLVDKVVK